MEIRIEIPSQVSERKNKRFQCRPNEKKSTHNARYQTLQIKIKSQEFLSASTIAVCVF